MFYKKFHISTKKKTHLILDIATNLGGVSVPCVTSQIADIPQHRRSKSIEEGGETFLTPGDFPQCGAIISKTVISGIRMTSFFWARCAFQPREDKKQNVQHIKREGETTGCHVSENTL